MSGLYRNYLLVLVGLMRELRIVCSLVLFSCFESIGVVCCLWDSMWCRVRWVG